MRAIIIGCGRMGSGLAQTLMRRGHQVVIIDRDPQAFERLGTQFRGQQLAGHGFDRNILLAAGIERSDALAAVTSNDNLNLIAARAARLFFRVPRVVARLYDPHKAEIYRRLGIQTVSTTTWGINRITELLSYSELDVLCSLGAQVDLIELEAPPTLAGQPINNLNLPGEILVVAISRAGNTFLPTARTVLQPGDLLHLAVLASSADTLKALLSR